MHVGVRRVKSNATAICAATAFAQGRGARLATLPDRVALLDEGGRALDAVGGLLEEAVGGIRVAHGVFLGHLVGGMDDVLRPFQCEGSVLQALFGKLDGLVHDLFGRDNVVDEAELLGLLGQDFRGFGSLCDKGLA